MIRVDDVKISYGQDLILDKMSFNIEDGTIAAIIGPNGSGKTSLLKAMLGLIPHEGIVLFDNKKVSNALIDIGYVPQRFTFDKTFPITVHEFLHFYTLDGHRCIKEKKVLSLTGIGHLKNELLGNLSGGQLQRVLIAASLITNPRYLFLDEPLAGIDIEGARDFYDLIKELNEKRGVTIVMISHELNMVYNYVSQVICLNRSLVCNGTPEQALTKETLEKLYGKDTSLTHHNHH